MMLQKVLDEIIKKGVLSPQDIAKNLELTLEDVEFALDYWIKKGKISKQNTCKSCNFDCSKCSLK